MWDAVTEKQWTTKSGVEGLYPQEHDGVTDSSAHRQPDWRRKISDGLNESSITHVTNQNFVVFNSEGMHRVILCQRMNVEH